MMPFFSTNFLAHQTAYLSQRHQNYMRKFESKYQMGRANQAIATLVLIAFCSSVRTSRALIAPCGTYPKQNVRPFSMSSPILSNLGSNKTIGKTKKESIGKKHKVLFLPIAAVDPSLHPNHTTTPLLIRWKCLTNKRDLAIDTTI